MPGGTSLSGTRRRWLALVMAVASTAAATTAVTLAVWHRGACWRMCPWTWRCWSPGSRSSQRCSDEGGWRGRRSCVDFQLLQQQVRSCLCERGERPVHLEDGHHLAELTAEAAKEREHHLPIVDGIAELGKGSRHRFELAAVVGDSQGLLAEVAEFCFEQKRPRLPLAEELVLEVAPRPASGALSHHQRLLQVTGDGAVDPCQDAAIGLNPCRARRERFIFKDVTSQGIFAKDSEEHATPLGVGICRLIEKDRDERLHVDDGSGLRPEGLMGMLIRVQSGSTEAAFLGAAGVFGTVCSSLSRRALVLGGSVVVVRHREGDATAGQPSWSRCRLDGREARRGLAWSGGSTAPDQRERPRDLDGNQPRETRRGSADLVPRRISERGGRADQRPRSRSGAATARRGG
jgi:hypothetical protein